MFKGYLTGNELKKIQLPGARQKGMEAHPSTEESLPCC